MGIGGLELLKPDAAEPDLDEDDSCAHIVIPASAVTEAIITGKPCMALCGKLWVPTKDPLPLPLCEKCKGICQGMGWKIPEV